MRPFPPLKASGRDEISSHAPSPIVTTNPPELIVIPQPKPGGAFSHCYLYFMYPSGLGTIVVSTSILVIDKQQKFMRRYRVNCARNRTSKALQLFVLTIENSSSPNITRLLPQHVAMWRDTQSFLHLWIAFWYYQQNSYCITINNCNLVNWISISI